MPKNYRYIKKLNSLATVDEAKMQSYAQSVFAKKLLYISNLLLPILLRKSLKIKLTSSEKRNQFIL